MGFGNKKENFQNLDVAVCTRKGKILRPFQPPNTLDYFCLVGENLKLKHFLVDRFSVAYVHRCGKNYIKISHQTLFACRDQIELTSSDIDKTSNFVWCQFRRPLKPLSMWDLDLSQPLHHFFFKGDMNGSM